MSLKDPGYNSHPEKYRIDNGPEDIEVGRVVAEHKERYIIRTTKGEFEAEITGNMRFTARSHEDFPAVGDWVAVATFDSGFAIIHKILPRFSVIKRKAVGKFGEFQVIAANIDYAFIVQAVGHDFNLNRLERYLTICRSSNVSPIIVISKVDLIDETRIPELLENIKSRIKNIPVLAISNETQFGYDAIKAIIERGKTYCMLGSSGAGKSTLLNNLSGKTPMRTSAISQSTNKGRHVTTHRELVVLENGGALIDNPGMREVGIVDSNSGLESTFDNIVSLSKNCKFKDCTHTNETGCFVLEAIERGELDRDSFENYLKLEKEKAYFNSTIAEKRKKDKAFGRMFKNYKKDLKRNKY